MPDQLKYLRSGTIFPHWLRNALRAAGLYSLAQRIWHPIKNKLYEIQSPHSIDIKGTTAKFRIRDGFDERMVTEHVRHERALLADMVSSVRPTDVFGDIGANIGLLSCLVGQTVDHVIAFEPHPGNYTRLRENLKLNSVGAATHQVALSDTDGDLKFILPADVNVTGGAAIMSGENEQKWHFEEQYGGFRTEIVSSVTGDSFFMKRATPVPTVLKIDVEGADMNVLQGLRETISESDVRLVYIEVHRFVDEFGFEQRDVDRFLEDLGFTTERLFEYSNGNYFVRAER